MNSNDLSDSEQAESVVNGLRGFAYGDKVIVCDGPLMVGSIGLVRRIGPGPLVYVAFGATAYPLHKDWLSHVE